ncbi:MAG: integration host factor [Gammaproteobacteria bacterium CG11_big_fil_rev_8_21_14_0_20_46_22]|nr:MAG: integration host factor [Gammaproteobacteria bacterium CG12_big_fil_rev_8_21_14_0_65_46_12]PIR11109.1 MAG: integration host factor [Gammaproteobacteria bacterium CG11_big_fil_rev_8_21_14_0_20_46_22]
MATKKKAPAKKKPAAKKAVRKAAPKKAVKKAPAKKAVKKTTTKKAAPKKAVKKAPAKKAAAPKALGAVKKAMTKSQVVNHIAESAELSRKQVAHVLELLEHVIVAHVKKGGVGSFKLNGLMNIKAVQKPARKARKGVNPFTGAEIMIKAKPAYRSVRVTALKRLKEIVA